MLNPINFISKFFKSINQKELDRIQKIVEKVNKFEEEIIKLNDEDKEKMIKFLEILEEDDDVQNVFTNAI